MADSSSALEIFRFAMTGDTSAIAQSWSARASTFAGDALERAGLITLDDRAPKVAALRRQWLEVLEQVRGDSSLQRRMVMSGMLGLIYPETVFPLGYNEVRYFAPALTSPLLTQIEWNEIIDSHQEKEPWLRRFALTPENSYMPQLTSDLLGGAQYRSIAGKWLREPLHKSFECCGKRELS